MSAKIIDGNHIAKTIRSEVAEGVKEFMESNSRTPRLVVVLVGDDPASRVYVNMKEKAIDRVGLKGTTMRLDAGVGMDELLDVIEKLNRDPDVDGILVQLPLPRGMNELRVIEAIDPAKDVDGFHPINIGRLVAGEDALFPCTPNGIVELLLREDIELRRKHVVVVGRSNIVGKPLANLLLRKGERGDATVTVCHSRTANLPSHTTQADILVAAIGAPGFITADMVKKGAVVVDVGMNRVHDPTKKRGYKLVGDVLFEDVVRKASAITPVPGGVGPMTVAMLMYNTLKAAQHGAGDTGSDGARDTVK